MTTVAIDDALATRLLTVRGTEGDLNALVAEALAEVDARIRQKHGYPDLSHLTRDQFAEEAERVIAVMDPQVRAEMEREGWL